VWALASRFRCSGSNSSGLRVIAIVVPMAPPMPTTIMPDMTMRGS